MRQTLPGERAALAWLGRIFCLTSGQTYLSDFSILLGFYFLDAIVNNPKTQQRDLDEIKVRAFQGLKIRDEL